MQRGMDNTTTPMPKDSTKSGLEFMMDLLHIEIAIYAEEKDFEGVALMCRHYLAYHAKWKEVSSSV